MLFLFPPYLLRLVIRGNGLTGEILFPIIQKLLFSQHLVLLSLIKETQFKYNFLVFSPPGRKRISLRDMARIVSLESRKAHHIRTKMEEWMEYGLLVG